MGLSGAKEMAGGGDLAGSSSQSEFVDEGVAGKHLLSILKRQKISCWLKAVFTHLLNVGVDGRRHRKSAGTLSTN